MVGWVGARDFQAMLFTGWGVVRLPLQHAAVEDFGEGAENRVLLVIRANDMTAIGA